MTTDTSVADKTCKDMADELRRAARQASAAAGSFLRWSVYLETDPDSAIAKMRTVLITPPSTGNPSPFLSLIAATVLSKIDPASIETCRQRREQIDREWAEACADSRSYWQEREKEKTELKEQVAEAKAERISGQGGNVVTVDFIGAS